MEKIVTKPELFGTDYELGELKAINKQIGSQIGGCYFHFTQSLYRRIQSEGLVVTYGADIQCRIAYRKIETLAFIPPKDVVFALKTIKAPNYFKSFLEYFENTYIGAVVDPKAARIARKTPPFPIATWSIYSRVLAGLPRTSNGLESWHKQFEGDIACKHPIVYKLIKAIQKEQKDVRVRLCRIRAGDLNEDKPLTNKDKRILKLVQNYSKDMLRAYFED